MLTKELIIKKIEDNKEIIKQFGVVKLSLFGSYARDEQKNGSDIDILIEFEEGRGLFRDYSGLLNFLEELFDSDVDLVKSKLVREELKPYILEGKKYEARI